MPISRFVITLGLLFLLSSAYGADAAVKCRRGDVIRYRLRKEYNTGTWSVIPQDGLRLLRIRRTPSKTEEPSDFGRVDIYVQAEKNGTWTVSCQYLSARYNVLSQRTLTVHVADHDRQAVRHTHIFPDGRIDNVPALKRGKKSATQKTPPSDTQIASADSPDSPPPSDKTPPESSTKEQPSTSESTEKNTAHSPKKNGRKRKRPVIREKRPGLLLVPSDSSRDSTHANTDNADDDTDTSRLLVGPNDAEKKSVKHLLLAARRLFTDGEYASVLQVIDDALSQKPSSSERSQLQQLQIRTYRKQGNYPKASEAAAKLSQEQKSKDAAIGRFEQARLLTIQKKFSEAVTAWQRFLANRPGDKRARAHFWLGRSYYGKKSYSLAEKYYLKSLNGLKTNSRKGSVYYHLGTLYELAPSLRDFRKSARYYRKAASIKSFDKHRDALKRATFIRQNILAK